VPGEQGDPGAAGTARAYARIIPAAGGTPDVIAAKGVSGVKEALQGVYCVAVPGIDPREVAGAVSADFSLTASPRGNGVAMAASECSDHTFGVATLRFPAGGGPAESADDVGFTIVVP